MDSLLSPNEARLRISPSVVAIMASLWIILSYITRVFPGKLSKELGKRHVHTQLSELSSRSNTSRTTDIDSDEECQIQGGVVTRMQENEWGKGGSTELQSRCVVRVVPRNRMDFDKQKPDQFEHSAKLIEVLSGKIDGAMCLPNRTFGDVSYYDRRDWDALEEETEDPHISMDIDTTAQRTTISPCYHVHINLNRPAQESAKRTLERVQISLNRKLLRQECLDTARSEILAQTRREKRIAKALGRRSKEVPAAVVLQQDDLESPEDEDDLDGYRRLSVEDFNDSESLWHSLGRSGSENRLQIGISGNFGEHGNTVMLPLIACPPTIMSVHTFMDFTACVFVGVPLVVEVQTLHASELAVVWYADGEEVRRGSLVYTPCEADLGKTIAVLFVPRRDGHDGSSYEEAYAFDKPVQELPDLPLIEPLRRDWQCRDEKVGDLRVFTYNLLADLYASREVDQKAMYNHCPSAFLDKRVRMPLLLYEMLVFKPDVVCLQEVDHSAFSSLFRPVLESQGYQGYFSNKASSQLEGCAMFWSLSCFHRAENSNMRTYCLRDLFHDYEGRTNEDSDSIHGIAQLLDHYEELSRVVKDKVGQVLQAAKLRVKKNDNDDSKPDFIVLGNTHLFYHPMADHIRALQACVVCHQLEDFRNEGTSSACPLVFCGDLNSNPLSGAIRLLVHGYLEPDHLDAWKYLHEYEWNMGDEGYLIEHGYIGNEADSADPIYEDEAYEDAVEYLEEKQEVDTMSELKPPRLSLPQNFPELVLGYEETPVFTNYAVDFSETLDYIFASKPSKREKLGFTTKKAAPMPSTSFMEDFVAMPNKNMPSDHVSLLCDLDWIRYDG